ncbi:hypothetical protein ACJJTC_002849 [Scirpophaga incertulas]
MVVQTAWCLFLIILCKHTKMTESTTNIDHMGAVEYRMPESLNLDDVDKCWPRWQRFKQAFKIFLLAAGFERLSEQRKAAILLNCVGHQAQELYFNVLKVTEPEEKLKLEEILTSFDEYFRPKQNEVINTYNFNKRNQQDGETFDAFYTAIRKLAENCNFDTQKDRMLRDRIVIGVSDHRMQQKLLEVKDLSLDKAVDICRSAELSKEHIKTLTNPEVYAVQTATPQHRGEASSSPSNRAKYTNINNRKSSNSNNNTFNKNFYLCKKCNKVHGPRSCPAFGKTCICSLDLSKNEWLESLDVENKRIIFKCDTGAQINVLGINDLKKIVDDDRRIKLSETKIIIEVFGGTKIVPLGKVKLNIAVKNDECKINTEFIIIKEKVRPILGLSSLIALKLLNNMKKAETITNINTKDTIINNNCELFQGVGEFKNPLKLRVQPGVEPVVRPPRRVPNALRSRLADKLDALVKHKIIDKPLNSRTIDPIAGLGRIISVYSLQIHLPFAIPIGTVFGRTNWYRSELSQNLF